MNRKPVFAMATLALGLALLGARGAAPAMPQQTVKNPDGTTTTIENQGSSTIELTHDEHHHLKKIEYKDKNDKTTRVTYYTDITGGGTRVDTIIYYPGGSIPQQTTTSISAPDGSVTTETVYYDPNDQVERRSKQRDQRDENGNLRRFEYDYNTGKWHEVKIPPLLGANVPETPPINSTAQPGYLVGTVTSPGVYTAQVTTPNGTIAVNLPSDAAAGDTITGTVVTQPAGKTPEERAQNLAALKSYLLQLGEGNTPVVAGQGTFTSQIPSTLSASAKAISLETPRGETVATTGFPVSSTQPPPPTYFTVPTSGQAGKNVVISGPTSGAVQAGDSVTIGGTPAPLIVKGPRGLVVQNPSTTPGPTEMVVRESGQEIRATFDNRVVKLTTTQLHLLKHQKAILTTTVEGLSGITQPAVVTLVNYSSEVVSMSGGDVQHRTIQPSEVPSDGTVSFQTTLTARESGAYSISATVSSPGAAVLPAMNLAGKTPSTPPPTSATTTPTAPARQTPSSPTPAPTPPTSNPTSGGTPGPVAGKGGAGSGAGGGGGGDGGGPGGAPGGPGGGAAGGGHTIGKPPELPPPPAISIGIPLPRRCKYKPVDGYFEPTQGVWQDDTAFEDKPGKQLVRLGTVDYRADLPMVAERDTVLAGVHHYVVATGGSRLVNDRENIALSYETNCNQAVPVRFKFTVLGPGQPAIVFYGDQVSMALIEDPPKDPPIVATVKQWAYLGVPRDSTFKFQNPGFYKITAELVKLSDGSPVGISMALAGQVIRTHGPVVNFVPVQLREEGFPNLLQNTAKQLAEKAAKYIPDFYPLQPGGLPTRVLGLRNFTSAGIGAKSQEDRTLALLAELEDALTAGTFLNGAGRVVVILDWKDYEALQGTETAAVTRAADFNLKKAGVVLNWKLIIIPVDTPVKVIAHELVHTLPGGWSSPGMLAECGHDYHNEYLHWANGLRLVGGGDPLRREKIDSLTIMGPDGRPSLEPMEAPLGDSSPGTVSIRNPETGKMESKLISEQWITQCTYWHLTKILPKPPDPPVLLVRGIVSQRNGQFEGKFRSFYDLMGEADVPAGAAGEWAVALLDAQGGVLGEYRFAPHWSDAENTLHRDLVAFDFRVPALPGVMQAELKGPRGVLDTVKFSSRPPEIQISSPAAGSLVQPVDGRVHIRWTASGEAGRKLLSTVLYSPGGDQSYAEQTFEQAGDSFDIELAPGAKMHFVKVMVTDGTRSAERVVKFRTP